MPKRVGVKTAYDFVAGVIPYQSLIFNLPSFLSTMIIQFCPKDDSSSRLLLLPLCIDLGLQRTDHSRPPLISVLNYCSFFILFIFFHLPFSFFFFFSYIHMSSLLIFILLIGGKLIFQHFWSRFVTFVNAEPCSLSIPLLLIISTLTPQAPVPPCHSPTRSGYHASQPPRGQG